MAGHGDDRRRLAELPHEPVHRYRTSIERFLHIESASGVVLLAVTIVALALANSDASEWFLGIWKVEIGFRFGDFELMHSLKHWINDGLMGIFFFVVGLEVKREFVMGELRDIRRASLPIAAALGGMIVPALLYLMLQAGTPTERGWGIPMATDIAFVVGCLALLGSRVPASLRALLLTLAIADDIGAILVIAIGYTEGLSWVALGLAGVAIGFLVLMAKLGVRSIGFYLVVGFFIWLAFHESGIHATIAGVILGLLTPTKSWVDPARLQAALERTTSFIQGEGWREVTNPRRMVQEVETAVREAFSPLERLETALHPWSSFVIMPIFALANAGVVLELDALRAPVANAVMLGLVVGKPVGIVLFSFAAIRLGLAALPRGVSWGALLGGGCLAGIGFTMALFIAGLALGTDELDSAKVGVLAGSLISGLIGMAILVWQLPAKTEGLAATSS